MAKVDTEAGAATFVMPFYNDRPRSTEYAESAIASVLDQSDPDWRLVIVDDCSPTAPAQRRGDLAHLAALDPGRIVTLSNEKNRGQGICRNIGVDVARRCGSPIVLFLDADDLAHPRRLEVTRRVLADTDADFVYSDFTVIDQDGESIAASELTPSIAEILDELARSPVEGSDCWIPIATRTGTLIVAAFGFGAGVGFVVITVTAIAKAIGNPEIVGLPFSLMTVFSVVGGLLFSRHQPGWPQHRQLALLMVFSAVALMIPTLFGGNTVPEIVLCCVIAGISFAPQLILQSTILEEICPPDRVGQSFGWLTTAVTIGNAAAQTLGGALSDWYSTSVAAGAGAILLAGMALVVGLRGRRPVPAATP